MYTYTFKELHSNYVSLQLLILEHKSLAHSILKTLSHYIHLYLNHHSLTEQKERQQMSQKSDFLFPE